MQFLSYMGVGKAMFYRGEFKGEDYLQMCPPIYNNAWETHTLMLLLAQKHPKQARTGLWVQAKGITTNDFSYNNIGATSSRLGGNEQL